MNFDSNTLRITEVFYSLQGESQKTGLPTVFIRLTGCPLRCGYCDTTYAFKGGSRIAITQLLEKVQTFQTKHVCVTGGEPLAQPGCLQLLKVLSEANYLVSLETSGAFDISEVDKRVMIILDLKTPDSKECDKNKMENLTFLKKTDQIKFVICSRTDYEWAVLLMKEHRLEDIAEVLFSPAEGYLDKTLLAEWILEDRLNVRFQIQLHKILWDDARGR